MGTKPTSEHGWLGRLVGEWRVEYEMTMGPDQPTLKSAGTESVKSVGGLRAFSESRGAMPDGTPMTLFATLGYDVSFKEYRGCWFGLMSSHLWKPVGTLDQDGTRMTLDYEGPSMVEDGKTAPDRDVIEILDADRRTLTSYSEDEKGEWQRSMTSTATRTNLV